MQPQWSRRTGKKFWCFRDKEFFPVELHFFFNPLEKKSAPEHAQISLPAVLVFQRI
jgi:hypothetical protein